jgi:zinc transporter ZupT
MSLLTWIIIFSLLGGVLSVLAAAAFLLFPQQWRSRLLPHFINFAIGSLLGAAFLALLPHALEGAAGEGMHSVTLAVLLGVLVSLCWRRWCCGAIAMMITARRMILRKSTARPRRPVPS